MKKDTLVLYIHGKGGAAGEVEHYKPFFPHCDAVGLDYKAETPWDAKAEFPQIFKALSARYDSVILIANSIGAYFSMYALPQEKLKKAYFISPIVDMKKLIGNMMRWANVTEDELREKETVKTDFGETLSWEYLCYVRAHPVCWTVPTEILYGGLDDLTDRETVTAFANSCGADLTVMKNGEHWFHTPEQMTFLDDWISGKLLKTERLILRPWRESDAERLYEYAKDPAVGPIAGWPVHTSAENSREIIRTVLSAEETYAVCLKTDNRAIGSVGLFSPAQCHTKAADTEMEIGYWIGVPFWGKGYIPEAVRALLKRAFEELGCTALWCGYYDGNEKSKRCQEKCGFVYHHTEENQSCILMGDVRTEHFSYLTKEAWQNKER